MIEVNIQNNLFPKLIIAIPIVLYILKIQFIQNDFFFLDQRHRHLFNM